MTVDVKKPLCVLLLLVTTPVALALSAMKMEKRDMVSLPGTSEKERPECLLRKSKRGIFEFPHQTQTQETSVHKKGQPGRKVQVCLLTGHSPPPLGAAPPFLIFLSFVVLISVPWSCHMSHPWKTNNARALHPKVFTRWPTSQRRDPCRNRDVSVRRSD